MPVTYASSSAQHQNLRTTIDGLRGCRGIGQIFARNYVTEHQQLAIMPDNVFEALLGLIAIRQKPQDNQNDNMYSPWVLFELSTLRKQCKEEEERKHQPTVAEPPPSRIAKPKQHGQPSSLADQREPYDPMKWSTAIYNSQTNLQNLLHQAEIATNSAKEVLQQCRTFLYNNEWSWSDPDQRYTWNPLEPSHALIILGCINHVVLDMGLSTCEHQARDVMIGCCQLRLSPNQLQDAKAFKKQLMKIHEEAAEHVKAADQGDIVQKAKHYLSQCQAADPNGKDFTSKDEMTLGKFISTALHSHKKMALELEQECTDLKDGKPQRSSRSRRIRRERALQYVQETEDDQEDDLYNLSCVESFDEGQQGRWQFPHRTEDLSPFYPT